MTNTNVEIVAVTGTTAPGIGPIQAAKFTGSSNLHLGANQANYNINIQATFSLLFKITTLSTEALLFGFGNYKSLFLKYILKTTKTVNY